MRWFIRLCAAAVLFSFHAAAEAPPSTSAMSLRDAVNYALEHSPELKSAQAEIHRREGLVAAAHSFLKPQVEVWGDAAHSRFEHGYPAGTPPSLLRFDRTQYTAGADLKFLAWDFRKTELELSAARERVAGAGGKADRLRQEIMFETARFYLQALTYSDLIRAAESRIQSLQSLLERANKLIQGGRAVPVDALKIQTRIAQIENDLAILRSGRRITLSNLAAVMGYDGDLPEPVYTTLSPVPQVQVQSEAELLHTAKATRPEMASQEHEIKAEELAEEAARKSVLPRIDLRASVIQYLSNTPAGFPQLIGRLLPGLSDNLPSPGNAATDWLVGVHVSFPLFDGGRRKGQIESAQAQLEQARLAQRQLELRIAREVRTSLADLESAQSRVRSLQSSVAESERVLHDERLKFEAGRSVINCVLDAESALLTNQSLLSQAERSVAIAGLDLDFRMGRIDASNWPDR